jgi:hypothetical protein
METVVVRLKVPIRVGREQIPNNAVIDVEAGEAAKLLDYDPPCAEETDAIERYPIAQPIMKIDDFPIWGSEKFPRDPEIVPPPHPSAFTNDVDRHVEDNIRGGGAGAPTLSKEAAPARIDESTIDQSAVKEEQEAAAAARVATAVPVTLVEEPKTTKAKH